jgi:hypothetical protein
VVLALHPPLTCLEGPPSALSHDANPRNGGPEGYEQPTTRLFRRCPRLSNSQKRVRLQLGVPVAIRPLEVFTRLPCLPADCNAIAMRLACIITARAPAWDGHRSRKYALLSGYRLAQCTENTCAGDSDAGHGFAFDGVGRPLQARLIRHGRAASPGWRRQLCARPCCV